jgi:molybdate transport system substrate-binding protein
MRRAVLTLLVVALLVPAGAVGRTQLTVYAAASLTGVFPKIDSFERYSFAASNQLAAQIQQGAPADIFASANTSLPNQLYARGLCSKPVAFARNTLVVVVPKSNPAAIRRVSDLTKRGLKVVVAGPGVPVGSYTLQVLKNMSLLRAVQKNIVSEEADVREVLSKVALGESDAGFVYATDAKTVATRVKTIKVPAWAQPKVQYGICVVSASTHKADAQAFVKRVLSTSGQAKLAAAGFLPRLDKR